MKRVPQSYTYFKNGSNPLNGQRLASDGVNAYTYTANGNTLTRNGSPGDFTFGRDTDERMTSISGAATASYTYAYQGRRTSKTVSGSTTTYLYDGLNLIHTSGSSTADYLFGPGIDEPLAMSQGSSIYYFSVDGLGSVNLLTDTTGAVQNSYLYDAWGVTKSQTGALGNDFGYTGREFGEAGLWYYRARYYQAGIGRFISEDPIYDSERTANLLFRVPSQQTPTPLTSRSGRRTSTVHSVVGPNDYSYVRSMPLAARDPLGLMSDWNYSPPVWPKPPNPCPGPPCHGAWGSFSECYRDCWASMWPAPPLGAVPVFFSRFLGGAVATGAGWGWSGGMAGSSVWCLIFCSDCPPQGSGLWNH